MVRREAKHLKVLYFDLRVKALKEHFSETNPNGAYGKIREYLIKRDFSHEQYSGSHSKYKTTDLEIFDLVREMSRELPWFAPCLSHFEVTNIGANHDLMQLFEEPVPEPEITETHFTPL